MLGVLGKFFARIIHTRLNAIFNKNYRLVLVRFVLKRRSFTCP